MLLGGKTDSMHGEPLQVEAYVRCLTDGRYVLSTPMNRGRKVDLGLSALLRIEGIDVAVGSANVQVLDEQIFLLHRIDVNAYDIVALKSSHHFRVVFEALAAEIITVDSPGLSTSRLDSFDFTRVPRPVFPLDTIKEPSFEVL